MAQINDIVDELNTIATAFSKTFIFDEIGYLNEDKSKTYPAILVDSRNIDINPIKFDKNNLPMVEYTFKLFFVDTYFVSQQKTKTKQDKYSDLETIANQYIAEIIRRTTEDSTKGFFLYDSRVNNGFVVDKVHNDDLTQLVYSVVFRADNDCAVGTFSY